MATLNTLYPTLLDLAQMPENKDASDVINLLVALNPILMDAPAFPCNDGTRHKTIMKTGLPSVTWTKLYQGIQASKGSKQTVIDTTGMVQSASQVDQRLVDIFEKAEDKASMRMDEANDHLEAMAQEMATAIFYHDSSLDPSKPMGLSPRFNLASAENGNQIIKGGGSGSDNASIWLITWGKNANHLIYPKGYMAGVDRKDRGLVPVADASGNTYFAYREEFSAHFGLSVRNWQYIVRICNIDVSDLTTDAASGAYLVDLMTEAYYRHKGRRLNIGKTYFYANTTIVKFLDYQARKKTNINLFLGPDTTGPNAKEVLQFRGIPIHECDALLNTEATVP
jgi:hypothetical protein